MREQQNGPEPFAVPASIEILSDSPWQMSYGERAALEGMLSQRKPRLALEIGTAEGGSLERFALHSKEVHSFDLVAPSPAAQELENVTFHTGDSHQLLPALLAELEHEKRNVDFVLVDGDHSSAGVRKDLEDLLNSPAVGETLILMHDTMNDVVRTGLEQVEFEAWPKVAYVELDMVAGYMFREPSLWGEMWGGLGLVATSRAPRPLGTRARQRRYFDSFGVLRAGREAVLREDERVRARISRNEMSLDALDLEAQATASLTEQRDGALAELEALRARHRALEAEHGRLVEAWDRTMSSFSWRMTRPLRDAKARLAWLID